MEEGVLEEIEADIELNGWKKLGSEWERDKKPGSAFSIWRTNKEQNEKLKQEKLIEDKHWKNIL